MRSPSMHNILVFAKNLNHVIYILVSNNHMCVIVFYTSHVKTWLMINIHPITDQWHIGSPWWRHQMETFSALLAICAGNSPVPGEFPTQRPVTRSFDVYFDLRPNKRLSKHSWGWWFETPSRPLWCHRNASMNRLLDFYVIHNHHIYHVTRNHSIT